jgi:hypothetical protein
MSAEQRRDSERPVHRSTLTGARNDNSSLFSLDLIRRAEAIAARMPSRPPDESGMIDLRALAVLAKAAPSRADRAPLVVSASASLFATSPVTLAPPILASPGSAAVSDPPPNFAPSRSRLFLAMGAVAFVAVAAAAFLSMRGDDASPPVAAVVAIAPAPPPPAALPPTAAVAATPPIPAVTPGERAPAPESPKPAAPVVKAALPRQSAVVAASRVEPKESAPKVETKPAAPVCDLTCQMERAVAATK